MITFCIPTWNRSQKLKACVESIIAQSPHAIVICDNGSDDDTPEVCRRFANEYPNIKYVRYDDHVDFAGSFKRAVNAVEGDGYTWTFGDDDCLVETALAFVAGTISTTKFDFYHVAEAIRVGRAEAMIGSVWELCNAIGWLDFTGFISGNIAKTDLYKRAVNSANWELYGSSAYPQSLGILDSMAHGQSMMIELGCVESGKGDDDTAKRWADQSVCWKYLYVGDGLKTLVDQGKIPAKVGETFFRYLEEDFFSRMMRDFTGRAVLNSGLLKEGDWECFAYTASMVDGERGQMLTDWIARTRKVCEVEGPAFDAFAKAYKKLAEATESISMPKYPVAYLPGEGAVQ